MCLLVVIRLVYMFLIVQYLNNKDIIIMTQHQIHKVIISAKIFYASSNIKFPCFYSINWRTHDSKHSVDSQKYAVTNGKADINNSLQMELNLPYNKINKKYDKKQTQMQLNLISKTKAQQAAKMVGRINFELSGIINQKKYKNPTELPLQFCSVNGIIRLSFSTISIQKLQIDAESIKAMIKQNQINDFNHTTLQKKQSSNFKKSQKPYQSTSPFSADANLHQNKQKNPKQTHFIEQKSIQHGKPIKRLHFNDGIQQNQENLQNLLDLSQNRSSIGRVGSLNSNFSNDLQIRLLQEKIIFDQKLISQRNQQSKRQRQRYRQEMNKKQTQMGQMKNQISIKNKEIQKLKNQINNKMQQNIKLTLNIAALKDNLNTLNFKVNTFQIQIKNQININQQLKSYQHQYHQANKANERKSLQIKEIKTLYHSLQQTQKQTKLAIKQITQSHAALLIEVERMKAQNLQISEQNKQITILTQKLNRMTIEHRELLIKMQQQTINASALLEFEQQKRHQKHLFQAELQKYQNKASIFQKQIFNLNKKNYELQQLNIKSSKQKKQLQTQLQQLKKLKFQLSAKLNACQTQNCKLLKQLSDKKEENGQLNKALNQLVEQNNAIYQQYSDLRQKKYLQQNKHEQRQLQLNKTIFQLQQLLINTNDQKNNKIQNYQKEINKNNYQLQQKIKQLEQITLQSNQFKQKIILYQQQIHSKYHIIGQLQNSLNHQIQTNQTLNAQIISHLQTQSTYKYNLSLLQQHIIDILKDVEEQDNCQQKMLLQLKEKGRQINHYKDIIEQKECIIQEYKNTLSRVKRQSQLALLSKSKQISTLQQHNLHLQNELTILKDKLTVMKGQLESKTKQNNQRQQILKGRCNSLSQKVEQLQSKLNISTNLSNQLRQALREKQMKINECFQVLQKAQESNRQYKQYNMHLEQQNIDKKKQIEEKMAINQEYQRRVISYQEKLQILKTQVQTIQSKFKNQIHSNQKNMQQSNIRQNMQSHQQIKKMKSQIQMLQKEASKTVVLERALKIREIELNSLKYKVMGETEGNQVVQYMRIKDQEIQQLKRHTKNDTGGLTNENKQLKQKNQALSQQIQLIQQQKFNLQAIINEKLFRIQQLNEDKAQLSQELQFIQSRAFQLQALLKQNIGKGSQITNQTNKSRYYEKLQDISIKNIFADLKTILELRINAPPLQILSYQAHSEENANLWENVDKIGRDLQKLKLFCIKGDNNKQDFKVKLVNQFKSVFKTIQGFKIILKSYKKQ